MPFTPEDFLEEPLVSVGRTPGRFTPADFAEEEESSSWYRRGIGDPLVGLAQGVTTLPEIGHAVEDILSLGMIGRAEKQLGMPITVPGWIAKGLEASGLSRLDRYLSPEAKLARERFRQSEGFLPKIKTALVNPSLIANTVAESLPGMIGGGFIGAGARGVAAGLAPRLAGPLSRIAGGLAKHPEIAGPLGEGVISAGQTARGIKEQAPGEVLTPFQSATALVSGTLTSAFGVLGGRLAQRLGIGDVETILTRGLSREALAEILGKYKDTGLIKSIIGGMVTEGLIEELPQSVQEQIAQNLATGKDALEGTDDAAILGTLAGMTMGAGANVFQQSAKWLQGKQTPAEEAAAAPQPIAPIPVTPAEEGPPAEILEPTTQTRTAEAAERVRRLGRRISTAPPRERVRVPGEEEPVPERETDVQEALRVLGPNPESWTIKAVQGLWPAARINRQQARELKRRAMLVQARKGGVPYAEEEVQRQKAQVTREASGAAAMGVVPPGASAPVSATITPPAAPVQPVEGVPDASKIPSPTGVSEPEVRARVGEAPPLRQPGQAPEAAAPQAPQTPGVAEAPQISPEERRAQLLASAKARAARIADGLTKKGRMSIVPEEDANLWEQFVSMVSELLEAGYITAEMKFADFKKAVSEFGATQYPDDWYRRTHRQTSPDQYVEKPGEPLARKIARDAAEKAAAQPAVPERPPVLPINDLLAELGATSAAISDEQGKVRKRVNVPERIEFMRKKAGRTALLAKKDEALNAFRQSRSLNDLARAAFWYWAAQPGKKATSIEEHIRGLNEILAYLETFQPGTNYDSPNLGDTIVAAAESLRQDLIDEGMLGAFRVIATGINQFKKASEFLGDNTIKLAIPPVPVPSGGRFAHDVLNMRDAQPLLDAIAASEQPEAQDAALLAELALVTGLRPSEIVSLKWQDIDFDRGRVNVGIRKTERFGYTGTTIPFYHALENVLTRLRARATELGKSAPGDFVSQYQVESSPKSRWDRLTRDFIKPAGRQVGYDDLVMRSLRPAWRTHLLQQDVPPHVLTYLWGKALDSNSRYEAAELWLNSSELDKILFGLRSEQEAGLPAPKLFEPRKQLKERAAEQKQAAQKAAPAEQQAEAAERLVDYPVKAIPLNEMVLRPKLMQYKKYADVDAETGKVASHAETIQGPPSDVKAGAILLWEPKVENRSKYGMTGNERYIVADGHGRFNKYLESGRKGINAIILREAAGVSQQEANIQAALRNIADGKGTIYDTVKFLTELSDLRSEQEALARLRKEGIRSGQGETIAFNAARDTLEAFRSGAITPKQAETIAEFAPKDASKQKLGTDIVRLNTEIGAEQLKGAMSAAAVAMERRKKAGLPQPIAEQRDLFASPEQVAEYTRQGDVIEKTTKALEKELKAKKYNLSRENILTKTESVRIKREQLQNEIRYLEAELARWEKWWEHEDLRRTVEGSGEQLSPSFRGKRLPSSQNDLLKLAQELDQSGASPGLFNERDLLANALEAKANDANNRADAIQAELARRPDYQIGTGQTEIEWQEAMKDSWREMAELRKLSRKLRQQAELVRSGQFSEPKKPEQTDLFLSILRQTLEDADLLDKVGEPRPGILTLNGLRIDRMSTDQIRDYINDPINGASAPFKAAVNRMLDSGLLKAFPNLGWRLALARDLDARAQTDVALQLITLTERADFRDMVEEVAHVIYPNLSNEDRARFEQWRQQMLQRHLAHARKNPDSAGNRKLIASLERMIAGDIPSRMYGAMVQLGLASPDLYYLANGSEFFAHVMSLKGQRDFLDAYGNKAPGTVIERIRSWIERFINWVRNTIQNWRHGDETLWRNLASGKYNYVAGNVDTSAMTEEYLSPLSPEEAREVARGKLAGARIKAAAGEVRNLAEPQLERLRAAQRELDKEAYGSKQYQEAAAGIEDVLLYYRGLITSQNAENRWNLNELRWNNPELREILGRINGQFQEQMRADSKRASALQKLKYWQEAVYLEDRSRALARLQERLSSVQDSIRLFREMGVRYMEAQNLKQNPFASQIAELSEQEQVLLKNIGKERQPFFDEENAPVREADDPMAQGNFDALVRERAGEIREFDDASPDLKAKTMAYNRHEIQEFFVKEGDERQLLLEQYGREALAFERMLNDPNAQEGEVRAAATALATTILQLSGSRRHFTNLYETRKQQINKQVRDLEKRRNEALEKGGSAEFFLSEVEQTLAGARGLTGDMFAAEWQERRIAVAEAIRVFAERLEARFGRGQALDLLYRLADAKQQNAGMEVFEQILMEAAAAQDRPLTDVVNLETALRNNFGITLDVFNAVMDALGRNPDYASNIILLGKMSQRALQALPLYKLRNLEELLNEGDEAAIAEYVSRIKNAATNAATAADAVVAQINRDLAKLGTEYMSLVEAGKVWDTVFGTPDNPNPNFNRLYNDAVKAAGIGEQMVVSNGGNPGTAGGNSVTYRKFGDQPEVVVRAERTPEGEQTFSTLDRETFTQVQQWFESAANYVIEAQVAKGTPNEGKYDPATVAGLAYALILHYPTAMDPAMNVMATHMKQNSVYRWMGSKKFWRQFLSGTQFAEGREYRGLISAAVSYFNSRLDASAIMTRFTNQIIRARAKAMKSHPQIGNVELYVKEIFNPLATMGREHGVSIIPGKTNLSTNWLVTQEDMDLLKLQTQMYEEARRLVTQAQAGRPVGGYKEAVRGVRFNVGERQFVRYGASVGRYGLPRHISEDGRSFLDRVIRFYWSGEEKREQTVPTVEELGPMSEHPIAKFWHENRAAFIMHVMDAEVDPADRAVKRTTGMDRAYKEYAQRIRRGELYHPESLEEVVRTVSKISGELSDSRKMGVLEVRDELLRELENYSVLARNKVSEINQNATSTGIELGRTMQNEYTQPAAQLWLPSYYFDYGAISDAALLAMGNRITADRMVEFATAADRARAALAAEITAIEKAGEVVTGHRAGEEAKVVPRNENSYHQLQQAHQILSSLVQDIADVTNRFYSSNPARDAEVVSLIKSILLNSPNVGWRNLSLGQLAIYRLNQAIYRHGRALAFLSQMGQFIKTTARIAWRLVGELPYQSFRGLTSFLKKEGRKDFESFLEYMSQATMNHTMDQVRQTGFSNRQPIWLSIANEYRRIMEKKTQFEEVQPEKPIRKHLLFGVRAARTLLRWTGTEYADIYLNSMALQFSTHFAQDLERLAMRWGESRERQGLGEYNPADARWLVTTNEVSTRFTEGARRVQAAEVRLLMEKSDLTLEKVLWDFYKASKSGQQAPILTEKELLDLRRAIMREYNAADMANRPTAMTTSGTFRLLTHFMGWATDFTLKLASILNGVKGQGYAQRFAAAMPTMIAIVIAALILGQMSLLGSKEIYRWLFRKLLNVVTMLDAEWYTNAGARNRSLGYGMMAATPFLGDAVALGLNVTIGNRGWSPTSRILSFGLLESAMNIVRGLMTTTPRMVDRLIPATDEMARFNWFFDPVLRAMNPDYEKYRERRTAGTSLRLGLRDIGVPMDRKAGVRTKTFSGSEGPERRMITAMANRNALEFKRGFDELVQYHKDRGADDPERSALSSFISWNPATRAGSGRKPTEEELQRALQSVSASRRRSILEAFADYEWGAEVLGKSATFTRAERGEGKIALPSSKIRSALSSTRQMPSLSIPGRKTSRVRVYGRRRGTPSRRLSLGRLYSMPRMPSVRSSLRLPSISGQRRVTLAGLRG